jgi:fimbrial chaperone protein
MSRTNVVRAVVALMMGLLAAGGLAAASTLGIAPIRIELSSSVGIAVLTVRNPGDAPVVVQARPAAWSQQDGQDQHDETHDLLVTPPLFTLPTKGHQIVRVALLRKPDPARELDYRLVLSEVPLASAPEMNGLRTVLRITLPVFVAAQEPSSPELTWRHTWLADGTLQIEAQNHGNSHVQIADFEVTADHADSALHADAARYILPGSRGHWQLQATADFQHPSHIILHGHSDAGDFTVTSDSDDQ